jgi:hypothetical protein
VSSAWRIWRHAQQDAVCTWRGGRNGLLWTICAHHRHYWRDQIKMTFAGPAASGKWEIHTKRWSGKVGRRDLLEDTKWKEEQYCSVYSRCYATIVRWTVISDPFLGNGSVNTFPLQRLRMQWGKPDCRLRGPRRGVIKKKTGATKSVDSRQSVLYGTWARKQRNSYC